MPRKKSTTTAIRRKKSTTTATRYSDEITTIPANLNKVTKKTEEVKENRIRQTLLAKVQCDLFDSKNEVSNTNLNFLLNVF